MTPEEAYNSIYRTLQSEGVGHDVADKEATVVLQALRSRSELDLARMRENQKRARSRRLGRLRNWGLGITIPLVLIAGASAGIYKIEQSDNTDYAGYPPETAARHADDALRVYYGMNDLPANLEFVSQERDLLRGRKAWKVNFRNPNGPNICAFVWEVEAHKEDADALPTSFEVLEGNDCQ